MNLSYKSLGGVDSYRDIINGQLLLTNLSLEAEEFWLWSDSPEDLQFLYNIGHRQGLLQEDPYGTQTFGMQPRNVEAVSQMLNCAANLQQFQVMRLIIITLYK